VENILQLGVGGVAVVIGVVTATFFGTIWLGRRAGLGPRLSLLIATGFAICGASAIAAIEGVTEADSRDVAFAIALVSLFGTLAIFVLPPVGHALGLHGREFGSWVGASVHDVGQVVATASSQGPPAVQSAVVVKLTRVVLLAPIVAGVSIGLRRSREQALGAEQASARRPPAVPLFVVGFLGAVAVRSTGVLPASLLSAIADVDMAILAVALAGLGTTVNIREMLRVGWKPVGVGICSWGLIALCAYVGVRLTGA
jgi:uncharacterized integral membrane protein (TIGR00698 family)